MTILLKNVQHNNRLLETISSQSETINGAAGVHVKKTVTEDNNTAEAVYQKVGDFLNSLIPQISRCAIKQCNIKGELNMLKCHSCRLQVHYACTQLPLYQIYLFKTKKNNRQYRCDSCISDIPEDFCKSNQLPVTNSVLLSDQLTRLQKAVQLKEKENEYIVNENTRVNSENRLMKVKIDDFEKRAEILRKLVKDQAGTIQMKNQTVKRGESIDTEQAYPQSPRKFKKLGLQNAGPSMEPGNPKGAPSRVKLNALELTRRLPNVNNTKRWKINKESVAVHL